MSDIGEMFAVREDVRLESGDTLRKNSVVRCFAENAEHSLLGIEWWESASVMHSTAIDRSKLIRLYSMPTAGERV